MRSLIPSSLDPRRLHLRGHRGGAIGQHRSIRSLRLPLHRVAQGVVIALGFSLLLLLAQEAVALAWGHSLVWWMQALRIPGQYAPPPLDSLGLFSMPVAVVDVQLAGNSPQALTGHGLAALALWIVAGWLPDAARPGAYVLRFAVLIHAASVLFFAFWPASFAHSAARHVGGGLRQIWALMLFTPWLHLATFHLFPFRAWQRLALTTVSLAYLVVLGPLLYASHAALLAALGLVVMPLLHLLFGVMVPILGLVALYGWGMGWHDPARPGDRPGGVAPLAAAVGRP